MKLGPLLKGKTVAIVGRAGSIIGSGNGEAIDACDVVIRINWVLPTPGDQLVDVGARTDLLYCAKRAKVARQRGEELGVPVYRVRRKVRYGEAKKHFKRPKQFRPTTGLCAILEAFAAGASEVRAFGFDLFTSGHVQERDPGGFNFGSPLAWQHNSDEERRTFQKLLRKRDDFFPDRALREALK